MARGPEMTRRILSVWLPNWPITRLNRLNAPAPGEVRVTVEGLHGVRRLAAIGTEGLEAGLRLGQTLTDARAICPSLTPHDAEPAADEATLASLAGWCERFTPLAAADPPDGVWLDVTGCGHLFGDEVGLVRALAARLTRDAIPCRLALAGTTGTAWALARSPLGQDLAIVPPGGERAALTHLPVAGLRLDPRTVAGLRRLGLRSVGELARLPRAEITARFGPMPVLRLDQAFGTAEEAIAWPRPPTPFADRFSPAEPIGTPEDLGRALTLLAERLCQRLTEQGQGGHCFAARFFRVDGADQRIAVTTALPVREPVYLTRLLHEKLETVDPGFGVEAVVLEAATVAPLGTPQGKLLAAPDHGAQLATVVDTLANRIGQGRIWRAAPRESHVPERAVRAAPPLTAAPSWVADPSAPRPIRLLQRPERIEATAPVPDDPPILFRWRGALHRIRAASGPERIGAEWWKRAAPQRDRPETDLIRDYYRVEDTSGARFWVFRAGLDVLRMPRWYLHGLFG